MLTTKRSLACLLLLMCLWTDIGDYADATEFMQSSPYAVAGVTSSPLDFDFNHPNDVEVQFSAHRARDDADDGVELVSLMGRS